MVFYILYIVLLLSIIAFSPTRYFVFSYIALVSVIPGIVYCIIKNPSKILACLLSLFIITAYSGWDNSLQLWEFGRRLPNQEIIASESIWLLSFVSMKLVLSNKTLMLLQFPKRYFALFFILGVLIMIQDTMGAGKAMNEGSNSVYYVLPVLPCVMCCYPKYRYHALILVIALIVFSIKRSAFIIVFLMLLWLVFCVYKGIIKLKKSFIRVIFAGVTSLAIIGIWGIDYIGAILSRFEGISEDGGSGRDLIFEYAWELFLQTDIKHQLLGNGPRFFWASSQNISAAHNDFLEIIISCGLVGVLLFAILHFLILRILCFFVNRKSDMAIPMGVCYFTFIVWNLIACQFAYQSPTVPTFMFISLAEYCYEKEKNTLYCN